MTTALEGVRAQRHAPAALTPEKTRYPLCRWLGGPQGRSGQVRKIKPTPGFDPRIVQPVASRSLYRLRYPAHLVEITFQKIGILIYSGTQL
jgi:hypothetical protein